MRTFAATGIPALSLVFALGIPGAQAFAADTVRIELDMYSGVPNPVYTLRDSSNVAPIKRRVGHYEILAALSWPGCPEPRTGLGYRGVKTGTSFGGPQGYAMASGGSLELCPQSATCRSYCDYRCELERMALRACVREDLIPPSVLQAIPDSLLLPVCQDGMFTLRQDPGEAIADFSLMRRYQVVPWEDTLLDQDIVVTAGPDGWKMAAYFGIVDKGQQAGFVPFDGTELGSRAADSMASSYRARFDELNVAIPPQGYAASATINPPASGHLYIVKTSEGGHCALVVAGCYIGGIDRLHFYYFFTTDDSFTNATTTAAPQHRALGFPQNACGPRAGATDLRGRILQSRSTAAGRRCSVVNGRIESYRRVRQSRQAGPE